MNKLLAKILLLAMPFLACAMFVLYVDPFNYFNIFKGIPTAIKKQTVLGINNVLWYTIDYSHAPSPGVIIGDSRAERISVDHLTVKTGVQYKHLAASAGKLNEIADLFWFANSYKKLNSVYIVLNFQMYNQYAYANRIVGAEAAIKDPLLYIFDRRVIEASYLVSSAVLRNRKSFELKQPTNKDEFWTWTLNSWPNQHYGKWKYPMNGYKGLRDISDYCKKNNIQLTFIITPSHTDYQKQVSLFKLDSELIRFKNDISALAPTYDFDYINELTMNKDNFSDPLHLNVEVANSLIDEILSGNLRFGRLLKTP